MFLLFSLCRKLSSNNKFYFQWTSDQDITDAVQSIGVSDFVEVKFFENRANGQSKGFCVISLGSEQSMRICMERLPKKELHGQNPVVTFPTKQALNQVCIIMHYDMKRRYINQFRSVHIVHYDIHISGFTWDLYITIFFLRVLSLSRSVRRDLLQLRNRVKANVLITHINISHQCHLINSIPNTLNILNIHNKITVLE